MRRFALCCLLAYLGGMPTGAARGQGPPAREDWSLEHQEILNHPEAELLVRHGSVNNLTFGWPQGFDPFSGAATPIHAFPWLLRPNSAVGTDRIFVGSSYRGRPPTGRIDGYTATTRRPDNSPVPIPITFKPPHVPIRAAVLQVFVDDFQSPVWKSKFQVTMNGRRVPEMEEILNALNQSGPIGKLITLRLPPAIAATLDKGKLEIFVDDPTTGAGDGYAFDFFRLLINPRDSRYQGTLAGRVTDVNTGKPIAGATVTAGGLVQTTTAADGTYELPGVPAGHASVTAFAPGYGRWTVTVDLLAGKTGKANLELKPTQEGVRPPVPAKVEARPVQPPEPVRDSPSKEKPGEPAADFPWELVVLGGSVALVLLLVGGAMLFRPRGRPAPAASRPLPPAGPTPPQHAVRARPAHAAAGRLHLHCATCGKAVAVVGAPGQIFRCPACGHAQKIGP